MRRSGMLQALGFGSGRAWSRVGGGLERRQAHARQRFDEALFRLAQPERLQAARPAGVWLSPTDEPAQAVPLFGSIEVIAVQFPKFGDGRGYSTAALLRSRHGWRGELRAIGDVLRDQLFFMKRVGFDSFALRPDRNIEEAVASLSDFSDSYQGSVEPALPVFRRIDQSANTHR